MKKIALYKNVYCQHKKYYVKIIKYAKKQRGAIELAKSLLVDWENVKSILYHQSFSYIPKISFYKIINRYYNDVLANYVGIKNEIEKAVISAGLYLVMHNVIEYLL